MTPPACKKQLLLVALGVDGDVTRKNRGKMKRLFFRLLIASIIVGGSWLAYLASDYYDCSGPKAKQWLNNSTTRLDEVVSDQQSGKKLLDLFLQPETTGSESSEPFVSIRKKLYIDDLTKITLRAENRYKAQQSQDSPKCLSEVQIKLVDTFYYNWKYYDSALNGEPQLANNYANKFISSLDEMIIEFDRLSAKYGP